MNANASSEIEKEKNVFVDTSATYGNHDHVDYRLIRSKLNELTKLLPKKATATACESNHVTLLRANSPSEDLENMVHFNAIYTAKRVSQKIFQRITHLLEETRNQ